MLDKNSFNNWFNQRYEINEKNKIKAKGKNRYFTESDVYFEYENSYKSLCMPITFTEQEVVNELRSKYKFQSNNSKLSCRDWIISKINNNKHWKFNRAMTEIEYDARKSRHLYV